MHDVTRFSLKDMTICASRLRTLGSDAHSMEEAANRVARDLYNNLIDGNTGGNACALVRVFKTHPIEDLGPELQKFARNLLNGQRDFPGMKCMVLLGSAGLLPDWNGRSGSKGHKVIPLPSVSFVQEFPMIRTLVAQLGIRLETLLSVDPKEMEAMAGTTFSVIRVEEALGSPDVPAQQEFVELYGIRSVLGFGAVLPSGQLFAVILFLKCSVTVETARMFQTLALAAKISLLKFDDGCLFDERVPINDEVRA